MCIPPTTVEKGLVRPISGFRRSPERRAPTRERPNIPAGKTPPLVTSAEAGDRPAKTLDRLLKDGFDALLELVGHLFVPAVTDVPNDALGIE